MRTLTEKAYVALGSNIAARSNLPRAAARLALLGPPVAVSRVYCTRPVGPPGQPPFLNGAFLLLTDLTAPQLRQALRTIETDLGRVRSRNRYAPRPIDLDLCLLGSTILRRARWRLPDPDLLTRPYLARIMAELDPGFCHPITGETLGDLAARLTAGRPATVDGSASAALAALV